MAKENRNFKDSVFTLLFGRSPEKLIELYNAVEGKSYATDTEVQINTLEGVLYKDRINNISFLLDGKFIVLMEYQSTVNENMPLRMLLYAARLYEKIVKRDVYYKEKRIKIPTPEFVMLYNGTTAYPDRVLRLSDSYSGEREESNMLELYVKVVNIGAGKEANVLEKCGTLNEYSVFIQTVREQLRETDSLRDAIHRAMEICIQQDVLRDFLEAHGSEVLNMLDEEFNLDTAQRVWKEEGEEQSQEEIAANLLDVLPDEVIAEKTGLPLERVKELRKNAG